MNRKAFTLIEVLVSVVILSTVAVLLFEISTNSKNNFSFLSEKATFTTLASLPLMHANQKYNNSDKTLYEYIRYDYNIKDDDLRKYLKEKKLHLDYEDEFSTFSPLSEGDDNMRDIVENENRDMMDFTVVFDKVIIRDKKQSTFAYKIYIK
jgi:prepilin-type N-terminal cleavage/methylation domain-containing protein